MAIFHTSAHKGAARKSRIFVALFSRNRIAKIRLLRELIASQYTEVVKDYCITYNHCSKKHRCGQSVDLALSSDCLLSGEGGSCNGTCSSIDNTCCRYLHDKVLASKAPPIRETLVENTDDALLRSSFQVPVRFLHLQDRPAHAESDFGHIACACNDDGMYVDASDSYGASDISDTFGASGVSDVSDAASSLSSVSASSLSNGDFSISHDVIMRSVDILESEKDAQTLSFGLPPLNDGQSNANAAKSSLSQQKLYEMTTKNLIRREVDQLLRERLGEGTWWQSIGLIGYLFGWGLSPTVRKHIYKKRVENLQYRLQERRLLRNNRHCSLDSVDHLPQNLFKSVLVKSIEKGDSRLVKPLAAPLLIGDIWIYCSMALLHIRYALYTIFSYSKSGAWLKVLICLFFATLLTFGLSACSSSADEELIESETAVSDPLSYKLSGVDGELATNVMAHLNSMPVISKSRMRYYVREITEVTRLALRAFGYYHPKIKINLPNTEVERDREVIVEIDPGKPLFIRYATVEILGEGTEYKIFKDITSSSTLKSYTKLNHGQYEALKAAIHEQALSLGFFDGKFISSRIMVYQEQNVADIELIYDTGKRYRFGEILASDETKELLKPSTNLKKFKQGDPFSTAVINAYVQSLTQTNYYNSVDVHPALDKAHDYEVPLEVNLTRRVANNVRLGAGYSTDEGPRLLFEWNKPLLNSRGDSLTSLATITHVTQDAQVIYKIPRNDPNLDFYTISAIQTHTDLNDTVSDRSQLAFHYIANQTGNWRRDYALRFEYEDYDQASEYSYAFNVIPHLRLTRRESSGGFDPSRGYSLMVEALGASPAWGSDSNFFQIHAVYKGMIALTERSRFLFKLEQGANLGADADQMPPSLRFFAGGDSSVRGFAYRERAPMQLDGSGLKGGKYLTTGTAEVQLPIGIANSRLALFLDAGTATDDYRLSDFLWAPGIGYRFLSPYGIVRVDFAVGMQDETSKNYQVHFAFGPEF